MKALITVVYFDRPKMVRNALNSIRDLDTDQWELSFIDDGSRIPGRPIVEEILKDHLDKIRFYHIDDTIEQKIAQGHSRHGAFMNQGILESAADFGLIVCDDDALTSDGVRRLIQYYEKNPTVKYSYSHMVPFNPMVEKPGKHLGNRPHWLNKNRGKINPSCKVNSGQVSYRLSCFKDDGIRYLTNLTGALDSHLYSDLYAKYGPAPFNNVVVIYIADFPDQMGKRGPARMFYPKDLD
jgi:glycosyltransferase involved in cell wall biosynthesis